MADGLAEFITARLDEDEAAAKALGSAEGHWMIVRPDGGDEALLASETRDRAYFSLPLPMLDFLRHIARHDPARALREAAAKRAILSLHRKNDYESCRLDERMYPCGTIRRLAAVWSDHPDYRPEWKP